MADKDRSLPGAGQRLSRMQAGAAQTGRQGGGHLRQRHDDDRGRGYRSEKPLMNANEREFFISYWRLLAYIRG